MFLGIEIGGTKIQLGVGRGDGGALVALERFDVDAAGGAKGILARLRPLAESLAARHDVVAVGIGFGGPVDDAAGRIIKSHQIAGWENFPLVDWFQRAVRVPVALANDADTAALAEARLGSGRGASPVLYVTVGTGVGAGLVIDGEIYRGHGPAAIELGHLRPGLHADEADHTVESLASGAGIAAWAQARMAEPLAHEFKWFLGRSKPPPDAVRAHLDLAEQSHEEACADLLARAGGSASGVSAKIVALAAAEGNKLAIDVLEAATTALGWGIAQAITLTAPQVVIVGGGVSLVGESAFYAPLRAAVERYVFPPLRTHYQILPPTLGELPVVHGALLLARSA